MSVLFNNPRLGASGNQGGSADLGETIDQSLRFRSGTGSTGHLSRTITASSSTAAITISFWVKLGDIGDSSVGGSKFIFSSGTSGGDSGNIYYDITNQNIRFQDTSSYTGFTTQRLRDTTAWYHIVYRFDAANQFGKVYVNGQEHSSTSVTTSARSSYGAQTPMQMGHYASGASGGYANNRFSGYLAEFNMLFGSSLAPDNFGRTNSDGVWVPKSLSDLTSNQYGALGFRLIFDSSAGLGDDTAPTGGTHASANDFTATGFDTSSIASYNDDVYGDTSTTYNSSNTNKVFLTAAHGPSAMFDGDLANNACKSGTGQAQTWLYWRPSGGLSISSSLVVHCSNTADVRINGTSTGQTNGGTLSDFPITIANPPSTLTELAIQGNSISSATIYGVVVDGTTFVNNTDNDVDYKDTPTNNYATLNPLLARSNVDFSGLNFEHARLRMQYGGGGSICGMAGFGMLGSSGKYYWEVTLKEQKEGGLGIVSEDFDLEKGNNSFGTDTANSGQGWEWILTEGRRDNNNVETSNSHTVPVVGDTIGFLLDTDNGTCTIEINGVAQTSGNGAQYTNIPTDKTIYPYFRLGGASGDANLDWNFGQMPFLHEPTGYQHVATNSLTEPTIKNGKDHFQALLYTGNGVDSHAITGLNFRPDLVWIKPRSVTDNHRLMDSVRGVSTHLVPNSIDDEPTSNAQILESFDDGGFTLNGTDAGWNGNTSTYVAWCWKAGESFTPSQTGGLTNLSGSRNTKAGFSIVSYTGSSNNASVGHGLDAAPEVVIVKGRDSDDEWHVKHPGLSSNNHSIRFNSDAMEANFSVWQNKAPDSSVFYIGSQDGVNQGTEKFIAYCFHSVKGYSKFGKYGGAGETSGAPDLHGAYIETGFRPAFLLVKRINASGDPWILLDSSRDTTNFAFRGLQPNTTAQEPNSGDSYACDFLANGFTWRTANAGVNNNTATYVYFCFAENPFGGENAPPATAR